MRGLGRVIDRMSTWVHAFRRRRDAEQSWSSVTPSWGDPARLDGSIASETGSVPFPTPIWGDPAAASTENHPPVGWESTAGYGGESPVDFVSASNAPTWEPPAAQQSCQACDGHGQTCRSCLGNRGSWSLPTTENGAGNWVSCSCCHGSGRMQCLSCGAG